MDSKYTNPQSHRGMKAILSCLLHKDGNLGSLPVYHVTDVIGKHAHNNNCNHHFWQFSDSYLCFGTNAVNKNAWGCVIRREKQKKTESSEIKVHLKHLHCRVLPLPRQQWDEGVRLPFVVFSPSRFLVETLRGRDFCSEYFPRQAGMFCVGVSLRNVMSTCRSLFLL